MTRRAFDYQIEIDLLDCLCLPLRDLYGLVPKNSKQCWQKDLNDIVNITTDVLLLMSISY